MRRVGHAVRWTSRVGFGRLAWRGVRCVPVLGHIKDPPGAAGRDGDPSGHPAPRERELPVQAIGSRQLDRACRIVFGTQARTEFTQHVRACATESLHHIVWRGKGHQVAPAGQQRQQAMLRRVGFLQVIDHHQVQAFMLGGQELRVVLQDARGGGQQSGRVKGFGTAQVQEVAVFLVELGGGDPFGAAQ